MRAALAVAICDYRAEARFDGEPAEWCLRLDESWNTSLYLRVILSERFDAFATRNDGKGKLLLEGPDKADDFARAVLSAATGIWNEYGADGYDERWTGHRGFPLRGLRALITALSIDEPQPTTHRHRSE